MEATVDPAPVEGEASEELPSPTVQIERLLSVNPGRYLDEAGRYLV